MPELAPLVSTFSIVARDPGTRALGVAVQSRFFNVGSVVPWAEAGVGAVATQAFSEPGYGPRALDLLREGMAPAAALSKLLDADPQREMRQVAVMDAHGNAAAHTGSECVAEAGHRVGPECSVQGNFLASDRVCAEMQRAFGASRGPLAVRLVRALEAGQRAGGDQRGQQSAALLIVRPVDARAPWRNRVADLRVEDHEDPIGELARLVRFRLALDALGRAQEAFVTGRVEEAREAYDVALRASGRHDELLFWGGLALARMGEEEEGLRHLRAALRKNPRWRVLLRRLPAGMLPSESVLGQLGA